jgi:kinesin family protein 3/17
MEPAVAPPAFPAAGYAEAAGEMCADAAAPLPHPASAAPPPSSEGDNIRVVVRVRPPLDRELAAAAPPYAPAVAVDASRRGLLLSENLRAAAAGGVEDGALYDSHRFAFDRVFAPEESQAEVYAGAAAAAVAGVLAGVNASIIAYGQTGAGKTHTMAGTGAGEGRGVIPRAVEDVFTAIAAASGERARFLVRASYLQIYNEAVSDLLKPPPPGRAGAGAAAGLAIREDRRRGVYVEGLSEWVVRCPADVAALMCTGGAARATGATRLNELSSRSHAIFTLTVEKSVLERDSEGEEGAVGGVGGAAGAGAGAGGAAGDGHGRGAVAAARGLEGATAAAGLRQTMRVGKLSLVDLAGSERVHATGATGARLEESKRINASLSALGNVVAALTGAVGGGGHGGTGGATSARRPHVPYRDSKLTRILEDSLGGNCRTTVLAAVAPGVASLPDSLSALKFAARAKAVVNAPRVNEDAGRAALLRRYEQELRRLRAELAARSRDLVDRRLVLQLDEARRREQADKVAAIAALERQSGEIARQKAAMAGLQARMAALQGQLLVGGGGGGAEGGAGGADAGGAPAFRTLLAREQARIRGEYEARLAALEAERGALAEGRAAAERLRALLLKQRDVMAALTRRLAERAAELQEAAAAGEAAEARARRAEDAVDARTAELIALRKAAAAGGVASPVKRPSGGHAGGGGGEDAGGWTIAASPRGGGAGPQEVALDSARGSDDGSEADAAAAPPAAAAAAAPEAAPAAPEPAAPERALGPLEAAALERRCAALAAERAALRRILDGKVLAVLGELDAAGSGGAGGGGAAGGEARARVSYLRRLVAATVEAMENPPRG